MDDPFDLKRFTTAQDPVYRQVLAELKQGRKRTHWMWFVFPQVAGLGHSPKAKYYAIQSREEADAYFAHPILGVRLIECTRAVMTCDKSPHQVFGSPDDVKFRSCLTLFDQVTSAPLFKAALMRFYQIDDRATLDVLASWATHSRN
jgi:uncharacterized protein (DUF1810 family)